MQNSQKDQMDDASHPMVTELKDIKALLVLLLLKGHYLIQPFSAGTVRPVVVQVTI